MKIQFDIPKELHKALQIEKIKREKKTLAETILELLNEWNKIKLEEETSNN